MSQVCFSPAALEVVFVSPRRIRSLNSAYRQRDYPTDVLSFGYHAEDEAGVPLLGEIVIAPEVARQNSVRWGCPTEKELRKLLVHGILRLLGYDHETDNGEMAATEVRLIRRRSLAGGPSLWKPG